MTDLMESIGSMTPAPVNAFISYAPADERHRARLEVHVSLLKRQGLLRTFHHAHIEAGAEEAKEIAALLDAARLVLLLVSADYLAHDACYERELAHALLRHAVGDVRVIPVLVHACDWQSAPFAKLIPLPLSGRPVTSWRNRNEAWADVARGIRAAIEILALPEALQPRGEVAFTMEYAGRLRDSMFPEPVLMVRMASIPLMEQITDPPRAKASRAEVEELRARAAKEAAQREASEDTGLIGREADLLDVLEHIERGGVLLTGPDGVGKTTLARRIADELAPHYGRRIEINLRGSTTEPLSSGTAMALVLQALSTTADGSGDEQALRATYRAEFMRRRPLLLLDDAGDRDQVEPLVVHTEGAVLITAPRSLGLPGVYERPLNPLDAEDAAALVLALAPSIGETGAELVAESCGRSPFALSVAARALHAGPFPWQPFLERLCSVESNGEDAADVVMTILFELLPPRTRDLWCRLSAFPPELDAAEAERTVLPAITGEREAATGMTALVALGLIEGKENHHHHMHPVARAFAATRLLPPERTIAEGRRALLAARRSGDKAASVVAITNLIAVYQAIRPDVLTARHKEEWVALLEEQRQERARCADQVQTFAMLGHKLAKVGRFDLALPRFQQRLDFAQTCGDLEEVALGSLELGRIYLAMGDLPRALAAMQFHFNHAASRGDPNLSAYDAEISAVRAQMVAQPGPERTVR